MNDDQPRMDVYWMSRVFFMASSSQATVITLKPWGFLAMVSDHGYIHHYGLAAVD